MKILFVLLALIASSLAVSQEKKWFANFGVTSDYLWRGMSYSEHRPAAQGGLDHNAGNGLSLGIWPSLNKTIKGVEASLFYNNTNRRNPNTDQSKGDDTMGLSIIKRL